MSKRFWHWATFVVLLIGIYHDTTIVIKIGGSPYFMKVPGTWIGELIDE